LALALGLVALLTACQGVRPSGTHAARAAEREAIIRMLTATGWNRARAAALLRVSYRNLLYKLKEIDLRPPRANGKAAEPETGGGSSGR